ncbi:MAG: phosphoglycerate kinase [Bacillota bacterium]|nr:phosphoglycerate kinase [Thermoanaerobacteraceae bacterium]
MPKKTVRDVEVNGKRVLVRVDFNVPLKEGKVADDSRLKAALPTIRYLCDRRARVILISHLGRPKGAPDDRLRLNPVAVRLGELLGRPVRKVDDCAGPAAEEAVAALAPGEVLLLENIRFHPGESKNDPELARQLAALCDLYVNDAFGTAHRAHASTVGVASLRPAVAGFLLERELDVLGRLLAQPEQPFVVVVGGAKISDKIGVLENLMGRVSALLIGGGMANTFLAAQGYGLGRSLVETEKLEVARQLLSEATTRNLRLVLPVDLVAAESQEPGAPYRTVPVGAVPEDWMALDIGPETVRLFADALAGAKTVFWNGPLGFFEQPPFDAGTLAVARALPPAPATTVVGGGDTVRAVMRAGVADRITHISTGGGAALNFLEGKELPGVAVLLER